MADQLLLVNPRKRRRRRTTRKRRRRRNPRPSYVSGSTVARRNTNPRRRRRRTYRTRRRRNPRRAPMLRIANVFQDTVMPAAVAAGGAIGLDIIWGMLPLPGTLKFGPVKYIAKGVGAVAMGMIASMVVNERLAKNFTAGAMTVVMYEALREALATWMPQLAIGMSSYDINDTLGYPSAAMDVGSEGDLSAYFPAGHNNNNDMGAYFDESMGQYSDVDVFI